MTPTSAHPSRPVRRHAVRLSVFWLFCLAGFAGLSAQEPQAPEIPPLAAGRYILITQNDAAMDPVIFTIAKTKDGYSLVAEDSQFAETTITTDDGNYLFQIIRKGQGQDHGIPFKYILNFAGVQPESNLKTLRGSFTSIYCYPSPPPGLPRNSPSSSLGTFLLYPVDKAK